ncbi:MAG: UDP-N-acetylmuramoyl-L-alanine--D-glutamate ligase [Endomicrobium sp.]|jgi:UDP-N-acetylmuramoylalanine--D-glutamate ligase|nr:UDP-N-acetylmuramoyl-L-alanine--D-glutamate ligase [Endomicrobium sp.]
MKICVLGLGKSGAAAANLAVKLGYETFASDSGKEREISKLNKKVMTEFGRHSVKVLQYPVIIKSPGICSDIAMLKKAAEKNVKVISELAFSLRHSKYKKIIAVTGTNGKTTVTDLISKIVKAAFKDSIVCGNIGLPLSQKALQTSKNTVITMELSSYQLEDTPEFKPDISVLLNITPDHLEHHGSMAKYIKAKEKIHINQTRGGFAVINYDDKICVKSALKTKAEKIFFSKKPLKNGVYYDGGKIVINIPALCGKSRSGKAAGQSGSKKIVINPKINIVGMHNVENVLAATAAAYCAGVKPAVIEKIISSYKGVEHRIEYVRTLNGVQYYNDSKSTNVDSARVALESFKGGIFLIMGGLDKGAPYSPLKKLVAKRVKAVLLIGSASSKIKKELAGSCVFYDCKNIENAVKKAYLTAKKGDIVLLSPACASFDQFKNFEERGKIFKTLVAGLRHV